MFPDEPNSPLVDGILYLDFINESEVFFEHFLSKPLTVLISLMKIQYCHSHLEHTNPYLPPFTDNNTTCEYVHPAVDLTT